MFSYRGLQIKRTVALTAAVGAFAGAAITGAWLTQGSDARAVSADLSADVGATQPRAASQETNSAAKAAQSYTASTAPVTVSHDLGADVRTYGSCNDGFHVSGFLAGESDPIWSPTMTAHGDYIYIDGAAFNGPFIGKDSLGYPEYPGIYALLENRSFISDHTGYVTFTCLPN